MTKSIFLFHPNTRLISTPWFIWEILFTIWMLIFISLALFVPYKVGLWWWWWGGLVVFFVYGVILNSRRNHE